MVRQAKAADFEADPRVCDSEYLRDLSIARRNQGKQWVWVAASREEAQQPRDLPNEAYLTGSQAVGDPNKSLGMSMEMWAELARPAIRPATKSFYAGEATFTKSATMDGS